MAQCMAGSYWWHVRLQTSFQQRFSGPVLMRSTTKQYSNSSISSFLSRSDLEDFVLPRFRTEAVKSPSVLSIRTNWEITYNPWAVHTMNGFGKKQRNKRKEITGGPSRGWSGADDGDGGGGGGDDDEEEHIFLLPVLTLAFAAFHLYVHWIKDENLDFGFFGTGLILFGLLAVAAIVLNARTGIDAYNLGLGASVGTMVWTGEPSLRDETPAGILALFAAPMAVMFRAKDPGLQVLGRRTRCRCLSETPTEGDNQPVEGSTSPDGASSEEADVDSTSKQSISQGVQIDLNLPRRKLLVEFTCNACNSRTQRLINPEAYRRGTVFVQCGGCEAYHQLVDNLNLIQEFDFRKDDGVTGI